MPNYNYEILDKNGRYTKGIINAENINQAKDELLLNKSTIISLGADDKVQKKNKYSQKLAENTDADYSKNKKNINLSAKERLLIIQQLAVMLDASIPIAEALGYLAKDAPSPKAANIIENIRQEINQGNSFSQAVAIYPKIFPPIYRAIIKSGENSGNLGNALNQLAVMFEKNNQLLQNFIASITYPIVILLVMTMAIYFLMAKIIPKLVEQIIQSGEDIPFITMVVINISEFISKYALFAFASILIFGVAFWSMLKNENFAIKFAKFLLSWPVIGKVIQYLDAARFARSLQTMIDAGIPLSDALANSKETIINKYIKNEMINIHNQVVEGASFAISMKKGNIMPSLFCNLLLAGERSSQIAKMLGKAADNLEDEFNNIVKVFLKLLEPLIMVFLGMVILVVMLAIMLPIFSANNSVLGL